jgi:hypothetical protein
MSLVSYLADITERRAEHDARVIFEDFTYHARGDCRLSPKGEELAALAEEWGTSREKLIAMRQWAQRITKECEERLARELVVLFTLNEARDLVLGKQYITKGEAAEIAYTPGGDILDLDDIYGGLLVRGRYIFISETAVIDGLKRYEPDSLLNGLIHERAVA